MMRVLLIAVLCGAIPTLHGELPLYGIFAERVPFHAALRTVAAMQADLTGAVERLEYSYKAICLGDWVHAKIRAEGAARIMQGFRDRHSPAIERIRPIAANSRDFALLAGLVGTMECLMVDADRLSADTAKWLETLWAVEHTPIMDWPEQFRSLIEETNMPNATGGTVTEVDGYRIHTFTTSDDFVVSDGGEVEYLMVAGGGGGGGPRRNFGRGGGGGAGGMLTGTFTLTPGTYPVVVGGGGAGGGENLDGSNGSASSVAGVSASGGGGGGHRGNSSLGTNGWGGGSGGGGGGGPAGGGTGGAGTSGQGNNGGNNGAVTELRAGGGGGAGAVGELGGTDGDSGGDGGDGLQSSISGTPTYYAGGGGGGQGGSGGLGGGGNANSDGTDGLGGGGGGANVSGTAGKGGSGVVILRYPIGVPRQYRPFVHPMSEAFQGAF